MTKADRLNITEADRLNELSRLLEPTAKTPLALRIPTPDIRKMDPRNIPTWPNIGEKLRKIKLWHFPTNDT
jgi:hypothetical protein